MELFVQRIKMWRVKRKMKQPKKLTRKQKETLKDKGYNPLDYSLREETKEYYIFINKNTGRVLGPIGKVR